MANFICYALQECNFNLHFACVTEASCILTKLHNAFFFFFWKPLQPPNLDNRLIFWRGVDKALLSRQRLFFPPSTLMGHGPFRGHEIGGIYLLKVNITARREIWSKLKMETWKQHQDVVLLSVLLTWNRLTPSSSAFIVNFDQVIFIANLSVCWNDNDDDDDDDRHDGDNGITDINKIMLKKICLLKKMCLQFNYAISISKFPAPSKFANVTPVF